MNIEGYKFLDIDINEEDALDHIKTNHDDYYFKESSGGKLHVIIKDYCDNCLSFMDESYDGVFLFLNKGNKLSTRNWEHANGNIYDNFDYKFIYHFMIIDSKDNSHHFYFVDKIDDDKLCKIYRKYRGCKKYITFHLSLCSSSKKFYKSSKESSIELNFTFDEYIDKMKFRNLRFKKDIPRFYKEFKKINGSN